MAYSNPPALSHHFNRLQDKVIFVTGASAGIGEAAARLFAKEGAKVVLAARRIDRLEATVQELKSSGQQALAVACDVTKEESIEKAIAFTVLTFGRIDGAFNNAGAPPARGPLHTMKMEDFDRILDINTRGVFMCMKHEIAAMLKTGGGAIVNTSGLSGLVAMPSNAIHSASKFGVAAITRSAALDYAKEGIRVNAVAPGPTKSEAFGVNYPSEEARTMVASMFPMNYIAEADDVARVALFLLSEESRWTTGHVLPCDGGRNIL
ncbi:putative short-chain dehydrogenase [Tricladium varicosporioides]|nr:putative short-chain dehydrogenase [Hymenoscyphus varicosporioides]